jgi:hypothetical protein
MVRYGDEENEEAEEEREGGEGIPPLDRLHGNKSMFAGVFEFLTGYKPVTNQSQPGPDQ